MKSLSEQNKTLWLVTDKPLSKLLTSIISPDRILDIDVIDRWGKKVSKMRSHSHAGTCNTQNTTQKMNENEKFTFFM
ncbi:hypothetical protein VA249_28320 [Vibrio alfacsensis]|nr:hypothetical protein VA249_28320 [Vibrio alfacsensis]